MCLGLCLQTGWPWLFTSFGLGMRVKEWCFFSLFLTASELSDVFGEEAQTLASAPNYIFLLLY